MAQASSTQATPTDLVVEVVVAKSTTMVGPSSQSTPLRPSLWVQAEPLVLRLPRMVATEELVPSDRFSLLLEAAVEVGEPEQVLRPTLVPLEHLVEAVARVWPVEQEAPLLLETSVALVEQPVQEPAR